MLIKSLNRLFCILLSVMAVSLCLNSCTFAKNDQNYVVAEDNLLISKSDDAVCWVTNTNRNFYIEHEGQIKSKWDYDINMAPYYYSPLLFGNYLYYVGGIQDDLTHDVYIARIDYTKEDPKLEQITENYNNIFSYTVCENMIFFTAHRNGEINLYMKKLSSDKEEVLFKDGPTEFCTNGEKIIAANKIYDIKSKTLELINNNEDLMTLGVLENNYYCYYTGQNSEGLDNYYTVMQINLDNFSAKKLCEIPIGMTAPKLCDDKILFADIDIQKNCSTVGFYYYDMLEDKVVTVINSDNSSERYIDDNSEPIPLDYIIYNNMYYFHYGRDVITRVNMDTKKETVFKQMPPTATEDGPKYSYVWLSPEEYYANTP